MSLWTEPARDYDERFEGKRRLEDPISGQEVLDAILTIRAMDDPVLTLMEHFGFQPVRAPEPAYFCEVCNERTILQHNHQYVDDSSYFISGYGA